MIDVLLAELFKQRSTRSGFGIFAAMLVLVLLVVLLHGFGLSTGNFGSGSQQLKVIFGWGEVFGVMFAAMFGAMSITGEIRYGTIRPTFLVTPVRHQVVIAKVCASMLTGAGFGLFAGIVAAGVGTAALRARGIDVRIDTGDYVLLIAGGAVAAALWAAIGVGVGAIVRNQVPSLVGITIWLLFVENLLIGDIAGLDNIGQFLPGFAGQAMSGLDQATLLTPGMGFVLLLAYAAAAAAAGAYATTRRDFD